MPLYMNFDPTERHPGRQSGREQDGRRRAGRKSGGGRGGRGGRRGGGGRGRGGRGAASLTSKPAVGDKVSIVEKANYGTDVRSVGVVGRVLTRAAEHPRGFKVRLSNGIVGRVTELIERCATEATQASRRAPGTEAAAESSDAYLDTIMETPAPGIRLSDFQ